MLHSMREILVPQPGIKPRPLTMKFGVLIPGLPGKSLEGFLDGTIHVQLNGRRTLYQTNPWPPTPRPQRLLKLSSGFLHWPENTTDSPYNTQGLEGPPLSTICHLLPLIPSVLLKQLPTSSFSEHAKLMFASGPLQLLFLAWNPFPTP